MKKLLKDLKEQAQELIDFGNSHEKTEGAGMMIVIRAVRKKLRKKK